MLRVALTGGIATGKSVVRDEFARLGVPTSDADQLARAVVAPGTPGLEAVVRRFGRGILLPDGSLDRKALGTIVFADPAARADLEAIVHPAVREATDVWLASLPAETPFAVCDIPLLFEAGREGDFGRIIVTACEPATQLARLVRRHPPPPDEARARIAAQWPLDEKLRRADYIIRTDGTFAETDRLVREVYRALEAES